MTHLQAASVILIGSLAFAAGLEYDRTNRSLAVVAAFDRGYNERHVEELNMAFAAECVAALEYQASELPANPRFVVIVGWPAMSLGHKIQVQDQMVYGECDD